MAYIFSHLRDSANAIAFPPTPAKQSIKIDFSGEAPLATWFAILLEDG